MRVLIYNPKNFVFLLKCYHSLTQGIILYLTALLVHGEKPKSFVGSLFVPFLTKER